jgi:hypothetical protein
MRLDDDASFEVRPSPEAQVFMGGTRITIGACVKAPAIRIDAPLETHVGAFVVGKNLLAVVLVDVELRERPFAVEIFDRLCGPGIRRIRDRSKRASHARKPCI